MNKPKRATRNTRERRNFILAHLAEHGSVTVEGVASRFKVSTVTVRTDLRLLEEQGLLVRHYGGAVLNSSAVEKSTTCDQLPIHHEIKKKLAKAAIALIEPGDAIILDSGTTTQCIAEQLGNISALNVMTNSLPAMNNLAKFEEVTSMICGGVFCHKSKSFHGIQAEKTFRDFHFDKVFLGVDGFHLTKGISTYDGDEARLNTIMAEVAKQSIVVTDSSKFDRLSLYKILNLDKIDTIITDSNIPDHYRQGILKLGIELIVVEAD